MSPQHIATGQKGSVMHSWNAGYEEPPDNLHVQPSGRAGWEPSGLFLCSPRRSSAATAWSDLTEQLGL